jgi:hypothetical protein
MAAHCETAMVKLGELAISGVHASTLNQFGEAE